MKVVKAEVADDVKSWVKGHAKRERTSETKLLLKALHYYINRSTATQK